MSNPIPTTKAPFAENGYQFIQFSFQSDDIMDESSIAIIWVKCTKDESYALQRKFADFVGNKNSAYDHADDAVYEFMDEQEGVEWGFLPLDYVDL